MHPGSLAKRTLNVAGANVAVLAASAVATVTATGIFGASRVTDAFLVARSIPDLLVAFVPGSISVVATPLLVQAQRDRDENYALRVGRTLYWISASLVGAAILLIAIARSELVPALVPGFSPPERSLVEALLMITLPVAFLSGSAYVVAAILNAHQRFFVPAVAPVIVSTVVVAVLISGPQQIERWAGGYLIGSAAALAVTLSAAAAWTFITPVGIDLRNPHVLLTLGKVGPLLIVQLATQLAGVVVRSVGSTLAPGTVTAMSLSITLTNIPVGLIAYSLAIVLVPAFAERLGRETDEFDRMYERSWRLLLFIMAPIGALLFFLPQEIVRLIFQRGAFDEAATRLTAEILQIYAVTLLAQPLLVVSHRALVSLAATRSILGIELWTSAVLVGLSVVFASLWEHVGLALAGTLALLLNASLYVLAARRHRLGSLGSRPLRFAALVTASAVSAGALARLALSELPLNETIGAGPSLVLGGAVLGCAYLFAMRLLRSPELHDLINIARRAPIR